MVHLVLYGVVALALAGGLFAVAARFLPAGEQIAPPVRDEPPWELPPDRVLRAEDIDAVRLPVALRGYRFAETDILLDRLAGELAARDREIARLRGETVEDEPATQDEPGEKLDDPAEADPPEAPDPLEASGESDPTEADAETEPVATAAAADSAEFGPPSMHGTAAHYPPPPGVHDDYAQPAPAGAGAWAADAPPWGVAADSGGQPAQSAEASGTPAAPASAQTRPRRRRRRT